MIREALEYVVESLAPINTFKVGDDEVLSRPTHLPPKEPTASTLVVATLESVVSYLEQNRDGLDLAHHLVHVAEHDLVRLLGPITGRHRQREVALEARAPVAEFKWGQYYDAESFNIALQSLFIDSEARAKLLSITTRLRSGSELAQDDNGIAQRVTVKRGVELFEEAKATNPVRLRPWRTFREVEQPESDFVLRLREGDKGIQAALFEADGGAWRLDARSAVGEYLENSLRAAEVKTVKVIW